MKRFQHTIVFGLVSGLVAGPLGYVILGCGMGWDIINERKRLSLKKQEATIILDMMNTKWGKRMIEDIIKKNK